MERLSRRQQAILDFIRESIRTRGYPPSVREIGDAVGLASSSTVHGHLARLEAKGYLRRDPTKPRAILLTDGHPQRVPDENGEHTVMAPVVGKVTAGLPITAVEHVEGYFPLPAHLARNGEVFILRVQGDSMVEAGILDGDYVIVRKQPTAVNGDIVVAMTEDDEATVKRFYREDGWIRLQPENSAMEPLRYKHVTILGKVVGVFRELE
ncbi:MAG: transcriptional repressor LexA [Thermoflavifilum sp.]|nr:transcriptional repressor LexA [Thermoflavifilum sp.]MCL6514562.1 transcriptional repressor LexA [Alicyclobacillus sp.]